VHRLYLIFIVVVFFTTNVFAAQCLDVFPGANQTYGSELNLPSFKVSSRVDGNLYGSNLAIPAGNYVNVEVSKNGVGTFTTSNAEYRLKKLTVGKNATIQFVAGDYWIDQLRLEKNAKLTVVGAGTVRIYADSILQFASNTRVNQAAGNLIVVGYDDAELNQNADFTGVLYVHDRLSLDKNVSVLGAVTARVLNTSQGVGTTYQKTMITESDFNGMCDNTPEEIEPIANYRFDKCEYTGNSFEVIDQTGNYHATPNGVSDSASDAVINNSLNLTALGSSDWLNVPSGVVHGLNDFTLSFWVNTSKDKSQQEIFHALGSSTSDDELEVFLKDNDEVYIKVRDDSDTLTSSKEITDGNWHHIALTRVDNDVCLFVDGNEEECSSGVASGTLSVPNSTAVVIGQEQDEFGGGFSDDQGFEGKLDEFMVFDSALDSNDIQEIYDNQNIDLNYDGTMRDSVVCNPNIELVAGRVTLNNTADNPTFTHVCFDTPFSVVPVVFSLPTTANNGDRLALRIRNVTKDGFDIAQVESPEDANPNSPAGNLPQTVDFLAIAAGDYSLDGGATMRVSTLNTTRYQGRNFGGSSWETVSTADLGFSQSPSIIASIQTMNNETNPFPISDPFLATTVKDVTNTQFKIALERGETNSGTISASETIGYIAITSGLTGKLTDEISYESFRTANNVRGINSCRVFNLNGNYTDTPIVVASQNTRAGSDGGWLKRCAISTSSVGFSIVEDRDRDNDTNHIDERAGGLALGGTFKDFTNNCATSVDHFEINHDGNGLTCDAETITIKACADASCSTLNSDSNDVQLSINGTVNQTITVSGGSTSASFSYTDKDNPATLSLDQAYECKNGVSTSCDIVFADAGFRFLYGAAETTSIGNQVSGNNFVDAVKLQAVKDVNGVCEGLFTANKQIELSQQNIDPNGVAGLSFKVNGVAGTSIGKYPTYTGNITLNFGADSKAVIPAPVYLDAGQIRLHAKYNVGGVNLTGTSNDFWISPAELVMSAKSGGSDINGDTNEATIRHKAGQVFDFTVTALNSQGDVTENYTPNDIELLVTRTGPSADGVDGSFNYGTGSLSSALSPTYQSVTLESFDAGVSSTSNAYYSEVGLLNLDIQDVDYGFTGNTINADAINIGRFYPDHFDVVITNNSFADTCITGASDFTYIGQPFYYLNAPELTITAKNALGATTQNYTHADYQKLEASDINRSFPAEDTTKNGSDDATKMLVSATTSAGALSTSSSTPASSLGVMTYTFSDGDSFTYDKNANSLVGEFTMDYDIVLTNIEDSDGANASISLASDLPSSNTISPTGVNLRFGRWIIENTFGPETSDLILPMATQYYDGSNFITNTPDNCTSYDSYNSDDDANYSLTISDLTNPLPATNLTPISGDGSFALGLGELKIGKPTDGSQGQIRISYDATPTWLKFDWDGDGEFDNNPTAVATFGIFRGNDRIIYQREVHN